MSIFQFTHKHNTMAAVAILGVIIGLALTPSKESNPTTPTVETTEVYMNHRNVHPWLDSIKSLPKDQQKAKLDNAIESQLEAIIYIAERILEKEANSKRSKVDKSTISIMEDLRKQYVQQLKILRNALAALDK